MSGATHTRFENLWTSISLLTLRLAARRLKISIWELGDEVLTREARKRMAPSGRPIRTPNPDDAIGRSKLGSILTRLPSYRAEDLNADIAEFAHAEVTEADPLSARRVVPEDVHGVGAAFGHRLERRSG